MGDSDIELDTEAPLVPETPKLYPFSYVCLFIALIVLSISLAICMFMLLNTMVQLNSNFNSLNSEISNEKLLNKPKNIIFLSTDGMGASQMTFVRNILRHRTGLSTISLQLDEFLVGSSRTSSLNSYITDSVAGATAFATGSKTFSGYVSVDLNKIPLGTLLEAAQLSGMVTGIVSTKSVTSSATASFTTHVVNRSNAELIALQQSHSGVNIIFGGGMSYYTQRKDTRNLLQDMTIAGYHVLDIASFRKPLPALPIIGLFTMNDMSYEIDRNNSSEPSLSEMTNNALNALSGSRQGVDKGFFLVLEAGKIESSCKKNDPNALIRELLELDKTIEIIKTFQKNNPTTLFLSTSTQESGGLNLAGSAFVERYSTSWGIDGLTQNPINLPHETLASEFYLHKSIPNYGDYDLEMRNNYIVTTFDYANQSLELINNELVTRLRSNNYLIPAVRASEYLFQTLGISLTSTEETFLNESMDRQIYLDQTDNLTLSDLHYNTPIQYAIAMIISTRAGISWGTKVHSGVDVNVYAYGPGSTSFIGNYENTDIAKRVAKLMEWNLASVTSAIIDKGIDVGS